MLEMEIGCHCSICFDFKFDDLVKPTGPSTKHFHRSKTVIQHDLAISANQCQTCYLLIDGITRCMRLHSRSLTRESKINLFYYVHYEDDELEEFDVEATIETVGTETFEMQFFRPSGSEETWPSGWSMANSQRTTSGTESPECVLKASNWLAECLEQDEDVCGQQTETPLPTRILDVSNGPNVRLCLGENIKAQYCCLSHCWGTSQPLTTTKATLPQRLHEIPFNRLPKTFQDAVTMTRNLGVRYLWIDSLCIVQDDPADWEFEAARMRVVYSQSYVTFAATHSSSGSGGLFRQTPDVTIQGVSQTGEAFKFYARKKIQHFTGYDAGLHSLNPLLGRAWVFQERMLSPRVLHFGAQELFWECRNHTDCECGKIQGKETPAAQPKSSYSLCLSSSNPDYISRTWRSLVWQYTDLSITQPNDRFPALGGIARDFAAKRTVIDGQTVRPSRYYAGCWEDAMLDDLAWSVRGPRPRPNPWRAPSWSWASVEGKLDYRDVDLFYAEDEDMVEPPASTDYTRVVEVAIVPSGFDPYGRLSKGMLTMYGPLLEGRLMYDPDYITKGVKWFKARFEVGGRQCDFFPDYDCSMQPGHLAPGTTVYALLLKRRDGSHLAAKGVLEIVWLVLCKKPTGQQFERLGLLFEEVRTPTAEDVDGCEPPSLQSDFKSSISMQQICIV